MTQKKNKKVSDTSEKTYEDIHYTYVSLEGSSKVRDSILSIDGKNLYVVFYDLLQAAQESKQTLVSTKTTENIRPVKAFYPIEKKVSKRGTDFYGMRSSRYGSRVPSDATHMAIAVLGGQKIELLYSMGVPLPKSKTTVNFGDNFLMTVRRSSTNIFVALGNTLFVKKRVNEKKESVSEELKPGVIIINRKGS